MLKFILLFFVFIILLVAMIVCMAVLKLANFVKGFSKNAGGSRTYTGRTAGYGNAGGNTYGYGASHTSGSNAGETIIDMRDPQVASRKIIPHDEGEYVDYTE